MPRTPDVIIPPKEYYVKQRVEGYSNWSFAFFRELFQNSVDAGAKNVHITIGDMPGRGAFGRPGDVADVVRVSFTDDGKGMSEEVLRNVFFKPGRSTKTGGDTVGGFGTARVTLCFSQVNYRGHTGSCLFEGDGAEFDVMSVQEAAEAKREQISTLEAERDVLAGRMRDVESDVTTIQERRAAQATASGDAEQAHADRSQLDIEVAAMRAAWDESTTRLAQLRADLAEINAIQKPRKGCKFEIDIDPKEGRSSYRWVDRTKLLTALDDYLSMSDVPCKVHLNGEEIATKAYRGAKRRQLVAKMPDGTERSFAGVYMSSSDRAKHKGKMIVRVNGACMFTESTTSDTQVIVELDAELAREVLTETRDSFKSPYDRALAGFRSELELDVKSALEDKEKRKHILIRGGRGSMAVKAAFAKVKLTPDSKTLIPGADPGGPGELSKASLLTPEQREIRGYTGASVSDGISVSDEAFIDRVKASNAYWAMKLSNLPQGAIDRLFEAVKTGEDTFLSQWPVPEDVTLFQQAIIAGGGRAYLDASLPMAQFVASNLAMRMSDAGMPLGDAQDNKYADLHDIHIYAEDLGDDDKLKNAMRRWNPDFWAMKGDTRKVDIGRGMSSHRFLSAWTISCKYAIEALNAYAPHLFKGKDINWATGFYFGKSENRYSLDRFSSVRTAAVHKMFDKVHTLLVNPVLDDGKPAYDISKERMDPNAPEKDRIAGLQDLEAVAVHEACHIFEQYHNEDFSSLLTGAFGLFNRAAARAEMRQADAAVQAAYGKGRSMIQAMDDSEGTVLETEEEVKAATNEKPAKARKAVEPRPAAKLLAHAARTATAVVGIVSTPENAAFPASALKEAFFGAVSPAQDGLTEVDCDRLHSLETKLSVAAAHEWDEQISLAAFDEFLPGAAGPSSQPEIQDVLPVPAVAPASVTAPVAMRPAVSDVTGLVSVAPVAPVSVPPVAPPVATFEIEGLDDALDALRAETMAAPRAKPAATSEAVAAPAVVPGLSSLMSDLDDALDALRNEQGAAWPIQARLPEPPRIVVEPVPEARLPLVSEDDQLAAVADLVGSEWDFEMFEEEPAPAMARGM